MDLAAFNQCYRMHFLIKAPDLDSALPALRRLTGATSKGRAIQVILDVDPVNML